METPNEDIRHAIGQWLVRADEDLRLASHALKMHEEVAPYRLIAYHAQQCAEKCLKAFLVYHNVDFPYTHNIRRLLVLCENHATWPGTLTEAETLTSYAMTARYPGEDLIVTQAEARQAVEVAERVRRRVRAALGELGMSSI